MASLCREGSVFRCFIFAVLLGCGSDCWLRAAERAARNDFFAAAMQLPAYTAGATVQISPSTAESGEPLYDGQTVNNSVWLRWTPTYSGVIVAFPDYLLSGPVKVDVFEGTRLRNLFPLGAIRIGGLPNYIAFRVVAGHTYAIRLQDASAPRPGSVRYGSVYLRRVRDRWQDRDVAQRSSLSVHPALLSPSAQWSYWALWQPGPVTLADFNLMQQGRIRDITHGGMISIGGHR